MLTKEEILAKAKELELTLTDEEVAKYEADQKLPEKKAEEDDDKKKGPPPSGDSALIKSLRKELKEKAAKLKEKEDREKAAEEADAKKKGDYDTLLSNSKTEVEKAKAAVQKAREKIKKEVIENELKLLLLSEGLKSDHIPKAIRLIDIDEDNFTFKDEDSFDYELKDVDKKVKALKEELPELFSSSSSDDKSFRFKKPDPTKKRTNKDEEDEKTKELRSKFSALR